MLGPTRRAIQDLSYRLWEAAGSPPASQVSSDRFWELAELELTPTVVLAISQELRTRGIVRLPGDPFYPDFYYDENNRELLVCRGRLHDNGIYELLISDIPPELDWFAGNEHSRFDLNEESELQRLLDMICVVREERRKRKPEQIMKPTFDMVGIMPELTTPSVIIELVKKWDESCSETAKSSPST